MQYDLAEHVFTTPRGNPATFRYRKDTNDWNTLWACLNEDEYALATATITGTAVDAGGHLGGVGIGIAIDNPNARVYIVEPVPGNVDLMRWAIAENGVGSRVTVIEGAVGDGSDITVWFGYRGSEAAEHHAFIGNSTFAYGGPDLREREQVDYTSLTAADVAALAGPIDFLKIDTEGAEWPFLASEGAQEIPLIVGEWHPVNGHAIADLIELLPDHTITFTGPQGGPGGFRAVGS